LGAFAIGIKAGKMLAELEMREPKHFLKMVLKAIELKKKKMKFEIITSRCTGTSGLVMVHAEKRMNHAKNGPIPSYAACGPLRRRPVIFGVMQEGGIYGFLENR